MTNTATPRDLDPKFRDAQVPANAQEETERTEPTDRTDAKDSTPEAETDRDVQARLRSTEIPKDPNEGFITYRQPYVSSDGVVGEKVHGPMPVSEWAAYSKENGL